MIALISLSLSQIGGNFKTNNLSGSFPFFILPFDFFWQAGSANFYLPFGRAWELILVRTWFHFGLIFAFLEYLGAPWGRLGAVLGTSGAALPPSQEA